MMQIYKSITRSQHDQKTLDDKFDFFLYAQLSYISDYHFMQFVTYINIMCSRAS